MKNSIGKDLSKIPIPVNFSEPLSFLQVIKIHNLRRMIITLAQKSLSMYSSPQRLAEDFAYSEVLDKAAACTDDYEQMAYVAAFTVSSYCCTAVRAGKPFNPLLGETYELDRREDMGFR